MIRQPVEKIPSIAHTNKKAQEEEILLDDDDDNDNGGDEEVVIAKAGNKDTYPTQTIRGFKNIMAYASEFKWLIAKDEFRVDKAYKNGGTACVDQGIVTLTRSVGQTMIK